MGICPQALEFWSGLRVQRGQPGLPGNEKHQMSVRERPEGGLRGDIGAPKSDLGSRGQLGSFIGAWGSLSNEELGVRPQCLRTEGTGRNIYSGGEYPEQVSLKASHGLMFLRQDLGDTWAWPLALPQGPRPPPPAASPRVCPWYPRNPGFEPVLLLHNSFPPIHEFSPPASGS